MSKAKRPKDKQNKRLHEFIYYHWFSSLLSNGMKNRMKKGAALISNVAPMAFQKTLPVPISASSASSSQFLCNFWRAFSRSSGVNSRCAVPCPKKKMLIINCLYPVSIFTEILREFILEEQKSQPRNCANTGTTTRGKSKPEVSRWTHFRFPFLPPQHRSSFCAIFGGLFPSLLVSIHAVQFHVLYIGHVLHMYKRCYVIINCLYQKSIFTKILREFILEEQKSPPKNCANTGTATRRKSEPEVSRWTHFWFPFLPPQHRSSFCAIFGGLFPVLLVSIHAVQFHVLKKNVNY